MFPLRTLQHREGVAWARSHTAGGSIPDLTDSAPAPSSQIYTSVLVTPLPADVFPALFRSLLGEQRVSRSRSWGQAGRRRSAGQAHRDSIKCCAPAPGSQCARFPLY